MPDTRTPEEKERQLAASNAALERYRRQERLEKILGWVLPPVLIVALPGSLFLFKWFSELDFGLTMGGIGGIAAFLLVSWLFMRDWNGR
jgi:hypothetical protein